MLDKSRTQKSAVNVATNVLGQILTMVSGFVVRTVFIYTLGKTYLGINGLLANVLQVLSLADLGLETAIAFELYKPLASGDNDRVAAIMNFFKKTYRIIGITVLVVGVCLIPVLPFLLKGKTDVVNINIVYLLYLCRTVSSYLFFAYKKTLLIADQKEYKSSLITYSSTLLASVLQIVVLLLIKGSTAFYCYITVSIAFTIIGNFIISRKCQKQYPFLAKTKGTALTKTDYSNIKKNVVGAAVYKISAVVTNCTDNLTISALVSVDAVGLYSNYVLFTNYIQQILQMIFNALTASVGNLHVEGNAERNEFVFRCINFLNFWSYGLCSIMYFCLINPFILIWLNSSEYLLPVQTVFWSFFYIVILGLQHSVKTYRSACGLFAYGKLRPVLTCIINLGVSILLAGPLKMGINGVLLGTIVAHFTTLFWFDPILLYKKIFHKSPAKYFVKYIFNLVLITGIAIFLYWALNFLPFTFGSFVLRFVVVLVVPNVIFLAIYFKTEEFLYLKNTVVGFIKRKIKKR